MPLNLKITGEIMESIKKRVVDKDYKNNSEIKWNFTKFVIDREGNVVARFEPTAKMDKVAEFVESLL